VLTGHLRDEEVNAYYRAADVFLSASEHEGFGLPLVEAMAHDVPVVARATTAVPYTLGGSGLLIHEWDAAKVSELINVLVKDAPLRERVLQRQRLQLERFAPREIQKRLQSVADYLCKGEASQFIAWRGGI
jgi:glycosyltransferase involved in cell wall biosynthesis